MAKHSRNGFLKLVFAMAVVVLCIYIACSPLQEVDYKYLAVDSFESGFCLGSMIWLGVMASGHIALGLFVLFAPLAGIILFHDFKQRALGTLVVLGNAAAGSLLITGKLEVSMMVGTLAGPILLVVILFSVVIGEIKYLVRSLFGIGAENKIT